MSSWFRDPKQLVDDKKILEFWPTNIQTSAQRVNAGSRFIIYAACIHYLIKRDVRIFVLAATALGVLYVMDRSGMVKECATWGVERYETIGDACQLPTRDNPMANVLMGDEPNRLPACKYETVKADVDAFIVGDTPFGPARSRSTLPMYQQNALARQFVSGPVTTIPGDQTKFAEYLYGKKGAPMCKSDGSMCDPNARGVQLEAFAGLDPNGDARRTATRPRST
jgi:hypothetical protein|tara:strand:- start:5624 stop:6295 length:672 start_codon:yes stop_codon:yes gene_type:complete